MIKDKKTGRDICRPMEAILSAMIIKKNIHSNIIRCSNTKVMSDLSII